MNYYLVKTNQTSHQHIWERVGPILSLSAVFLIVFFAIDLFEATPQSVSKDGEFKSVPLEKGTYALSKSQTGHQTYLGGIGICRGKFVRESEEYLVKLPIWGDDLIRYGENPVIVGNDVSKDHTFVADPYLLVINGRLHMFFEAFFNQSPKDPIEKGIGEIWMAESEDGFDWSGFQRISTKPIHFSHPQAFIYDGKVHIFYNHNRHGSIHYRWSHIKSFPSLSEETVIWRASKHGWHHMVEFTIFEHRGIWYLLGITGNRPSEGWSSYLPKVFRFLRRLGISWNPWAQDQWVRGRWAGGFPINWDTNSQEIEPYPLIDVSNYDWLDKIVEITSLNVNDRLLLFMGTTRESDRKLAISTFAITHLSPTKLEGTWLNDGFTFPLASSGWDDTVIHRAHAAVFKDQWIFVYDAHKGGKKWKIGVATMPIR